MSKTAKSVKAICRKNDKFLCVESPDSNALFFPSIAVSSFRKDNARILAHFRIPALT